MNRKLSQDQVNAIRREYAAAPVTASGKKQRGIIDALSGKYGVTRAAICNVISRRTWKP